MTDYDIYFNYADIEPLKHGDILLNKNGVILMQITTFIESADDAKEVLKDAFKKLLEMTNDKD